MNRSHFAYPKRRTLRSNMYGWPQRVIPPRMFPRDEDRVSTNLASSTSHAINLPTCYVGDILIGICSTASGASSATLAGFNEVSAWIAHGSTGSGIFWRVADGTEGATATLTLGVASACTAVFHRISGADLTMTPKSTRSGTTVPIGLQPGRGTVPWLWLSYLSHIIAPTSNPPSNMENGISTGTNPSASGASVRSDAPSFQPNSWVSSSINGRAYTVAVAPRNFPVA